MVVVGEKRAYPRAPIKWPVSIHTQDKSIEGTTSNVSPTGVFIRCQEPLRLTEVFDWSINVPHLGRNLKGTAEVVWSNIYGPDDEITPRGMGVHFQSISDVDRRFIAGEILKYLELEKVEVESLDSLRTLIIDLDENL